METNGFSRRTVGGSTTLDGNLLDPKSWRNPRSTTLVLRRRSIRLPSPDVSSNGYRSLVETNGGIRPREYFIYHRNCFFSLFCRDDDICQRGLFPSGHLLQRGYDSRMGKEQELNWIGRFTKEMNRRVRYFLYY